MKKVLYIITGLNYGGAEINLRSLATEVKNRGYDVSVLSITIPHPDFIKYFNAVSIPVYDLGLRPGQNNVFVVYKAIKLIKKIKPDIVHTHMVHANILGRLVRLFVKIPVLINTAHNINEGGKFREWLYRYTDFLSDLTTNVSHNAADNYVFKKLVPKNKILYIPNGIETAELTPLSADEGNIYDKEFEKRNNVFVWLAVGRLSEQKDYPNLIEALHIVKKKSDNFIVLVAGDGVQRTFLNDLIKKLKLDKNVKLLGLRKDIDKLMKYADAFVMSSAWEGLPIVLLEATKSGLPIVATRVGGNEELVKNKNNGFLVKPKDPLGLANAMIKMMDLNENERSEYGQNSLEIVKQNFAIDKIIDTWIDIYECNQNTD